jgi:hypothetical protein
MAEPQEGEPPEFGWGLGQSVHVADKKNKEAVWAKGKVVGTEGTSRVNVRLDDGGGMVSVDMRKVKTLFTVNPKTGYDDMTSLYYLHEPGVSDNLGVRYVEDKIYTYVGRVLVVCNPFHRLEMPNPADYTGKRLDANPPHNYAIADAAYSALKKSGGTESQSVIISGESGAGKTESSKIVMRYITSVANPMEGEEDLPDRILNANPALEAFGNGTTTRNWNSSRFGKFTQLQFEGADLGGASIQTYLLEKSRVVFQGPKERNVRAHHLAVSTAAAASLPPANTSLAHLRPSLMVVMMLMMMMVVVVVVVVMFDDLLRSLACRCVSSFTCSTTSSMSRRWTSPPGSSGPRSRTTTSTRAARSGHPTSMTKVVRTVWTR